MMVDVTPGDSGANKGFWRVQLRDRYGRFVEMGGGVMFEVLLPGFTSNVRAKGVFRGMLDLETARIEVTDNSQIPKGVYQINRKYIEGVAKGKARLSDDYVAERLGKSVADSPAPPTAPELKKKVTGSEALKTRLKSVAKALKEEGRFPVPRQGSTAEIGKNSDISKGARIDYKKVFDSSPEVQERFKSFENMWAYVVQNGTDLTTQSPNDLSEIPEEMKALNRAYAEHVLGMEPDGLLTVYRNAVNGKDTESESAVGYVSLDRQMAWDYNSSRENIGANGRYEIDVKPDEVYGLIGYSRVEDEYGLTIGRGVTEQPGRVRRVGDLEKAELAPWLEEWNNTFARNRGQSPYRGFNVAGEYDFHEVEDFGEDLQAFLAKYGLQASDIAAMYDKLYGDGAYADYKASGNTVNYAMIRKMFTKLENGNLGLNAEYLDSFNVLKPNAEYKGDQFDNIMKMLSVFQELTGKYFMTHKTRDYTPPEKEDTRNIVAPGAENWMPILADILNLTRDTEDENNNFDPELGNKRLSIVMEKAGYNEKPTVMGQEEFDAIEGKTLYRGIVVDGAVDQYINSPKHFAGQGKFGNGTYSTDDRETAMFYAGSSGEGKVLEMKLSPEANVKRFDSRKEYSDWIEETLDKFKEEYANSGISNEEYYDFISQMDNIADWTNIAVMLGIDAVEFPHSTAGEERYTIILNRGKVIVNDKS